VPCFDTRLALGMHRPKSGAAFQGIFRYAQTSDMDGESDMDLICAHYGLSFGEEIGYHLWESQKGNLSIEVYIMTSLT
jgi:hypothetical protein